MLAVAVCNCNNHARQCRFNMELFKLSGRVSGGVCQNCRHATTGRFCHYCKEGFYRDPSKPLNHRRVCKLIAISSRNTRIFALLKFNQLLSEDPFFEAIARFQSNVLNVLLSPGRRKCSLYCSCECHPIGSTGKTCNHTSGQCPCKDGVTGLTCNRCARGYQQSRSHIAPCIKIPPRISNILETQNTAPERNSHDSTSPYHTEGGRGKCAFSQIYWSKVLNIADANDKLSCLMYCLSLLFNEYVPWKTYEVSISKLPWFSSEVKRVIRLRSGAYNIGVKKSPVLCEINPKTLNDHFLKSDTGCSNCFVLVQQEIMYQHGETLQFSAVTDNEVCEAVHNIKLNAVGCDSAGIEVTKLVATSHL
ncbi:hypothetical protein GQX74_015435 [Glossina fuscipes]|nr:hypothetical protein GQX74_015435 [Glossina fuscipes]